MKYIVIFTLFTLFGCVKSATMLISIPGSIPMSNPSPIPTPKSSPMPSPKSSLMPTPIPSPIPTIGNSVSIGIFSADSLATTVAQMGKNPAVLMSYTDFESSFPIDFANSASTYNAIPEITWELWSYANRTDSNGNWNPTYSPQNVIAGNLDAYIKSFALAAGQFNKPIYIRFLHEMNGNWYPWGYGSTNVGGHLRASSVTGADLVNTWIHVVNIFRANHVNNVHWIWCPNVSLNLDQIASMFPGDNYVDWVGMDGYNWGSPWNSFANIFGATYAALTKLSQKPFMIGETASGEAGGDKAAWILQSFNNDLLLFPRISEVTWFNQNKETDWRINSSSSSLSAIQQVYANWSSSINF